MVLLFADALAIVIENWMTDDQLWNEAGQELNLTETSEQEELEIESWMTNADLWKANVLFESFTSGNNTYYLVTSKKVKDIPEKMISGEIDRIANNYVGYADWFRNKSL